MKKQTGDKPFFDTNVLIYAFRADDHRSETAQALLAGGGVTGVQSLNEFVSVARRKLGMNWKEILESLAALDALCPSPVPLTFDLHRKALQIADRHGYHIFDSLIVAAALESESQTLYSEDLQDGQRIEFLTIRNPFRQDFSVSQ